MRFFKKKVESCRFEAFTLVELLIVMGIMGVMASIVVLNMSGARNAGQLSVSGETLIALLQQARADVSSGLVEDDFLLCRGAYFEKGVSPKPAFAIYDIESELCLSPYFEEYAFLPSEIAVSKIEVAGMEVADLWAMYRPPEIKAVFFRSVGSENLDFAGNLDVTLEHPAGDSASLLFNWNYFTPQLSISFNAQ